MPRAATVPDLSSHPHPVREDDLIAMFKVVQDQGEIKVVQEKHYRLVPTTDVTSDDLLRYRNSA